MSGKVGGGLKVGVVNGLGYGHLKEGEGGMYEWRE